MASLQDQLLKAGIVDKKKAEKIKKAKHKQRKQQPKNQTTVDETKVLAQKAQAEKAERDREINRQRQAEADNKAIRAQIIQLITTNQIPRDNGDQSYQFTDNKKIKKIYVTGQQHQQLVSGQIAIVILNDSYQLVPAAVAEKISQRDESTVMVLNQKADNAIDEDDPYAGFEVPDDLMW